MADTTLHALIATFQIGEEPTKEKLQEVRNRIKKHPEEIDQKNDALRTPCHEAALREQREILEILALECDADLNIKDKDRKIPKELALTSRTKRCIERLEEEQNNMRVNYQHLRNLIRKASLGEKNFEAIVKRIESAPEEVDQQDYWGRTACHLAMKYNLPEVVQQLILVGLGDFALKDRDQRVPFDMTSNKDTLREAKSAVKLSNKSKYKVTFGDNYIDNDLEELRHQFESNFISATTSNENDNLKQVVPLDHEAMIRLPMTNQDNDLSLQILTEIIATDNTRSLLKYLENNEDPNRRLPEFNGCSLVLFSFVKNAANCFLRLIEYGADVTVKDNHQKGIKEYIEEKDKEHRLGFLLKMKSILENKKAHENSKLSALQNKLMRLEIEFQKSLVERGLWKNVRSSRFSVLKDKKIDKLSQKSNLPKELMMALYTICNGQNDNTYRNFHPDEVRKAVIGLVSLYRPEMIMDCLNVLYPYFDFGQAHITFFLVKEMILWDDFYFCYSQPDFVNKKIPLFFEQSKNHTFFKSFILRMLYLKRQMTSPISDALIYLEYVLAQFAFKPKIIEIEKSIQQALKTPGYLKKTADILAHDLQALTMQFYHRVHTLEFRNKIKGAAAKNEVAKAGKEEVDDNRNVTQLQPTPTILEERVYFEKMNNFLVSMILQASNKDRIHAITLCIFLGQKLLQEPYVNINAAMILKGALNCSAISRLKPTFAKMDPEVQKIWDEMEEMLSEKENYKMHRSIMSGKRLSLPYVGLYLRDLTFGKDGNQDIYKLSLVQGGIYYDIFQKKRALLSFYMPFKSNLLYILSGWTLLDEDILHQKSIEADVEILELTDGLDVKLLQENINIYIKKKVPYQIRYQGEVITGENAESAITHWLIDKMQKSKSFLTQTKADELISLVNKAIDQNNKNALTYTLNPICHLSVSPSGYTPQLNKMKRQSQSMSVLPQPQPQENNNAGMEILNQSNSTAISSRARTV